MSDRHLVCRREDTPVSGSHGASAGGGSMPTEMLAEQVQRLMVFAVVAGVVWLLAMAADLYVLPHASGAASPNWRSVALEIAAVIVSAVMYAFVRWARVPVRAKVDAGVAFMLANAVGIAAFNVWALPPEAHAFPHLSWATVLILAYSIIAPTTPRRMLVVCLTAASMDPVAFGVVSLIGRPGPSAAQVAILAWPSFACAGIAVLPSRVLQRIGRRLREAQRMGSYELVERLGEGGMGEVWRATHRLLAREAAIKLVRPKVLGARTDAEAMVALRRFEREARATAGLSSPHTIHVYDFGITDDGAFYYVMELLYGRDLESLVREFGPLPPERVVYLLRQACHSLADAHERGLVHRDVKPANIYVCRMGLEYDFVKVLDFGLVKTNDRVAGETMLTLDQRTTGTPAYMAPEVILGDAHVDRRADVYALGCVAYYLLTGQLVFEGDTSMKVLMQHVHAQPAPPSQRTELPVPRQLDDLVLACLEKDPNRRPQNAWELFQMACGCKAGDGWNRELARAWWTTHLPDLTGPLTLSGPGAPTPPVAAARV